MHTLPQSFVCVLVPNLLPLPFPVRRAAIIGSSRQGMLAGINEEDLLSFDNEPDFATTGAGDNITSRASFVSQPTISSSAAAPIEHIAPDQNMDAPYKGTTIFEDLEEFKGIAHSCTLGLVNDKVVKARKLVYRAPTDYSESQHGTDLAFDIAYDDEPIHATMEKSLGIGLQRNPVLVMQQKFASPVVQIQRVGLIAFRSVFNLFMWSDPIASFWLLVLLICLVVVTALLPWRLIFFIGGLGFVGPQVSTAVRRRTNDAPHALLFIHRTCLTSNMYPHRLFFNRTGC